MLGYTCFMHACMHACVCICVHTHMRLQESPTRIVNVYKKVEVLAHTNTLKHKHTFLCESERDYHVMQVMMMVSISETKETIGWTSPTKLPALWIGTHTVTYTIWHCAYLLPKYECNHLDVYINIRFIHSLRTFLRIPLLSSPPAQCSFTSLITLIHTNVAYTCLTSAYWDTQVFFSSASLRCIQQYSAVICILTFQGP